MFRGRDRYSRARCVKRLSVHHVHLVARANEIAKGVIFATANSHSWESLFALGHPSKAWVGASRGSLRSARNHYSLLYSPAKQSE